MTSLRSKKMSSEKPRYRNDIGIIVIKFQGKKTFRCLFFSHDFLKTEITS